jgi:hypothetical protein
MSGECGVRRSRGSQRLATPDQEQQQRHDQRAGIGEMLARRSVELGKLSLVEEPSLQDLGPQAPHEVQQDSAPGMADRIAVSLKLDPDINQAGLAAVLLIDRDKTSHSRSHAACGG